jgi:peptidoglycan hydrolase CwlO-like protein
VPSLKLKVKFTPSRYASLLISRCQHQTSRGGFCLQEKSAAKLQRLPRESQQEYMRLLEENGKWSAEIAGQQAQLESLNARIAEAEEQLSMDRSREEGQSLESQLMRLQSQLKEVQEEARSARADPAELRDKLFRKTKEDNERLVRLQQVHREVLEDSEAKRKVALFPRFRQPLCLQRPDARGRRLRIWTWTLTNAVMKAGKAKRLRSCTSATRK